MLHTQRAVAILACLLATTMAAASDETGAPSGPYAPVLAQNMTLGVGGGARFENGSAFSTRPIESNSFAFVIRLEELVAIRTRAVRPPVRLGGYLDVRLDDTLAFAYSTGASVAIPVAGNINNYLSLDFSIGAVLLQDGHHGGGIARGAFGFHHAKLDSSFDYSWGVFTEARYLSSATTSSQVSDVVFGVFIDFPSILFEGLARLSH